MKTYGTVTKLVDHWLGSPDTPAQTRNGKSSTRWEPEQRRAILSTGLHTDFNSFDLAVWYPDSDAGFIVEKGPRSIITMQKSIAVGRINAEARRRLEEKGIRPEHKFYRAFFSNAPIKFAFPPSTTSEIGWGTKDIHTNPKHEFSMAGGAFMSKLRHMGRRQDCKGRLRYGDNVTQFEASIIAPYNLYIKYREVYMMIHPDAQDVPEVPEHWHTVVHMLTMLRDLEPKKQSEIIRNFLKSV